MCLPEKATVLTPDVYLLQHLLRWQLQGADTGFLCRVAGVTLCAGERSSTIWEGVEIELVLLHFETELVQVVQACDKNALWPPHIRDPPGTSS